MVAEETETVDAERVRLEFLAPPAGSRRSRKRIGRGPGSGTGTRSIQRPGSALAFTSAFISLLIDVPLLPAVNRDSNIMPTAN